MRIPAPSLSNLLLRLPGRRAGVRPARGKAAP